jgi:hypothetical protein
LSAKNNRVIYSLYISEKLYLKDEQILQGIFCRMIFCFVSAPSVHFYHGKISFRRLLEESINDYASIGLCLNFCMAQTGHFSDINEVNTVPFKNLTAGKS